MDLEVDFLRDHMSILDKELGTDFDHGVVLEIFLDQELENVLDMDQYKDLYIVPGMDIDVDLDMELQHCWASRWSTCLLSSQRW